MRKYEQSCLTLNLHGSIVVHLRTDATCVDLLKKKLKTGNSLPAGTRFREFFLQSGTLNPSTLLEESRSHSAQNAGGGSCGQSVGTNKQPGPCKKNTMASSLCRLSNLNRITLSYPHFGIFSTLGCSKRER